MGEKLQRPNASTLATLRPKHFEGFRALRNLEVLGLEGGKGVYFIHQAHVHRTHYGGQHSRIRDPT